MNDKVPVKVGFLGSQQNIIRKLLNLDKVQVNVVIHTKDTNINSDIDFVSINESDCTSEILSKHLSEYSLDLVIIAGFPFILSESLIRNLPPIYNIHYSLLPKYRGRHPIESAFTNGEEFFGVSIHKLTPDMDAGEIIFQRRIRMLESDDQKSLRRKAKSVGRFLLTEFVNDFISDDLQSTPQNEELSTHFPPRVPSDSRINWSKSSRSICRLVRVCNDKYPAIAVTNGRNIKIDKSYKFDDYCRHLENIPPGKVIDCLSDSFIVSTGSGAVLVANSDQPPSKLGVVTGQILS